MKTLVLCGTSRPNGNTMLVAHELGRQVHAEVVNLGERCITAYDYTHGNRHDDFIQLAEYIVRHEHLILATPLYWYSMSVQLKTFMDRLTDLITIRKDLGRALAGRSLSVLATGTDPALPAGFEEPFRRTCAYFDMTYRGARYVRFDEDLLLSSAARGVLEQLAASHSRG